MVHPAGGLSPLAKENFLSVPRKKAGPSKPQKRDFPIAGRKENESDIQKGGNRATFPKIPADQKLLSSFPRRKNAEMRECSRDSEIPKPNDGAEDQVALVFYLTRRLISKTAEPLNSVLIRDDERLERALGKIPPRLPISVRLILRKKRYIQFMLDNRERLIP